MDKKIRIIPFKIKACEWKEDTLWERLRIKIFKIIFLQQQKI